MSGMKMVLGFSGTLSSYEFGLLGVDMGMAALA